MSEKEPPPFESRTFTAATPASRESAFDTTIPSAVTIPATAVPWQDGSADIYLMPELLEHVADWQSCLDEAARMDLSLPGIGGLEAIRRIIARDADARVLVFSMHEDTAFVEKSFIGDLEKPGNNVVTMGDVATWSLAAVWTPSPHWVRL